LSNAEREMKKRKGTSQMQRQKTTDMIGGKVRKPKKMICEDQNCFVSRKFISICALTAAEDENRIGELNDGKVG
jgi:hypothetical protein